MNLIHLDHFHRAVNKIACVGNLRKENTLFLVSPDKLTIVWTDSFQFLMEMKKKEKSFNIYSALIVKKYLEARKEFYL